MTHPFLDVTKLTDEDIIARLGKAHAYMNYQSYLGHSPTVQSIKEVIQTLENERSDRITKAQREEFNKKYPNNNIPIELGSLEEKIRNFL